MIKKFISSTKKIVKRRWYLIIAAVLILSLIGWSVANKSSKDKPKNAYTVKRQTLRETVTFSGDIDAEEKATLRFQTSGKLAWVGVKEGETVNKYQGIASLDQQELKKTLQKELNTYVKSRLDFDQEKEDTREVVIGGLGRDARERVLRVAQKAQYDLNNSVIDVELQDLAIQFATIYTPIEGIVTKVGSKNSGVNVTPAQAEFEIVNPDTIFFSATADQTEVVMLDAGMRGEISLDSFTDVKRYATIASIAYTPKEDETGTVYQIKLNLDPSSPDAAKLRLGMTGDVTFVLKEVENAIAVPTTYIKRENGKPYVLKKVNNKPEKVFIRLGSEIDTATVVDSGIEAGDVVYD